MTQAMKTPLSAASATIRDNIYQAVLTVLSEQGVSAFTMERVAEAAGIAKGSIYNHFKNKEDLLRFVYRQTIDPIKLDAERKMRQVDSSVEKLKILVETWFRGIVGNRAMFEFLIHDRSISRMIDRVPDRARDICTDQAYQLFQQGVASGEFRSDLPVRLTAEMLFGAAFDVVVHQVASEETVDIQTIIETVTHVFLDGVRPTK